MKRIIVCFDGTWSKPADENMEPPDQVETNVHRFYKSVSETGSDGVKQVKWYDEGIGSHWYDRFSGGVLGLGLETNIIQGYKFLAEQYDEGDEVYLLGYSRGAYTARSLAGMIRNCGLIKKGPLDLTRIAVAYGIYRARDDGPDSFTARSFRFLFSQEISIKFIGVWDTVGALGIPLDIAEGLNLRLYEFHDTKLSPIIENAYHAVAIDEHRKIFDVTLWNPDTALEQTLEQRWFAGSHGDVGGGYKERAVSDLALKWMQDRAGALGLGLATVAPDANAHQKAIHDAYADFLKGKYAKLHARHFRTIGGTQFGNEGIDESVRLRHQNDETYRPQNPGFA